MQRKFIIALCLSAAVLIMAPALFAEETVDLTTTEVAVQAEGASKASATKADAQEEVQAQAAVAQRLGLPVAAIAGVKANAGASANAGNTCVTCSTHADCASVCGGGQQYFDYRCQWIWPEVCGEHIKQCWCS